MGVWKSGLSTPPCLWSHRAAPLATCRLRTLPLTVTHVLLALPHVHVDELRPLHAAGREGSWLEHGQPALGESQSSRKAAHLRKVMVHVVATAFASKVFPVPGGPYSNRPERHRPSDSSSGCSRGNWIVSRISFFTSWSPPTSCQDTEGICTRGRVPVSTSS